MTEDHGKLAPIEERAAAAYLKRQYGRLVLPEPDGTFRGEILEFPGCIATGDTPAEAYSALEEAATGWIESALSRGQTIPEPVDASDFSGRMVLRIPRSLHKKASRLAERDSVSLNQFITVALAEYVGNRFRPAGFNFVVTSVYTVTASNSSTGTLTGENLTVGGESLTFHPAGIRWSGGVVTPSQHREASELIT